MNPLLGIFFKNSQHSLNPQDVKIHGLVFFIKYVLLYIVSGPTMGKKVFLRSAKFLVLFELIIFGEMIE